MKNICTLILIVTPSFLWSQALEGTSNAIKVEVGKKKEVEQPPVKIEKSTSEEDMATTLESLGITKLPKYHALIVGISTYKNSEVGLPSLDMPVKDAEKLYQVLIDRYAFDPENVKLLKDATKEEIINHLEYLAENVNERDNVLIFYAGHGFYDKSKDFGYWLPSDAKLNSRGTWIPNSSIKDYVFAIKSKHTLLITDACFSGSIFKTRSVADVNLIKRFNEVYKSNSRKAMTSGNLIEVPDQSVFLKYLIKGLEENEDVFLSSTILFSRILEPISNNATVTPLHGIIQGAGDEGGDFVFIKKK